MTGAYVRPLDALETIELWPSGAPGMPDPPPTETVVERGGNGAKPDRAVFGISRPRLAVLRPRSPNGVAVIAMPGGAYRWLAVDKEAFEIGPVLVERGYTVFTLLYRLPDENWSAGPDVALSDAQRAMRLVRHRAAEFSIDPEKVVALGFSAGGHVCGMLATEFDRDCYDPVDEADVLSARPGLAAVIYGVQDMASAAAHAESRDFLLGPGPTAQLLASQTPALHVKADTPAHFLVHAEDDPIVSVDNTLMSRAALKSAGISVETHLFVRGGHGFGLCNVPAHLLPSWPQLFLAWMAAQGLS